MQLNNQSQSIIITGESGAGKTESTKQLLHYLCHNSKNESVQKIIDANPIMEALGNARTENNNNSSRYCRFLQVISIRHTFMWLGTHAKMSVSSLTTAIMETVIRLWVSMVGKSKILCSRKPVFAAKICIISFTI